MAFPIKPPVEPMLAKLEAEIPAGDGWLYEPKWDGFRAIVFRDGDAWRIDSRNKLRLDRYFPELLADLAGCLPDRCVVDGEIVIPTGEGLDFELLQLRLHPAASRVAKLSKEIPASFVAFDLLADGDEDLRPRPMAERRRRLCDAIRDGNRCIVTPQTADPSVARDWFDRFEGAGLDGLVAKPETLTYQPGKRVMVKVKHRRTADVVVGGYRMSSDGKTLGSLLLGIYDDEGRLRHAGFAASMPAAQRREILAIVEPLRRQRPKEGFEAGGISRWSGGAEREWVPVEPRLVCEVAFDHLQGPRFRHGTRLVRWRPDKEPRECTYDQFDRPSPFSLDDIRALSRQ